MGKKEENVTLDEIIEAQRMKLANLQVQMKDNKLPVVVLFEGYGAAGKGSVMRKVIHNLDPRFFEVAVMDTPSKDDGRMPFLYRHFVKIPENGKFTFFDSGWMDEIVKARAEKKLSKEEYAARVNSVKIFERQLVDNGYLVLKFFFTIDKKEQKRRIDTLLKDKNTKWRVSEFDMWQVEHRSKCEKYFIDFMNDTNSSCTTWNIIDSENKKIAESTVLDIINTSIEEAIAKGKKDAALVKNTFPLVKMPKLAKVDLDKTFPDEDYKKELDKLQKRLGELHNELYRRKIPVIVAYEGWDAAGKGGNIKRLTQGLDPRGYKVWPIASPEPHEKARHFLWRFFTRLPKTGHIAVFDRTWYGRVMVERLEGFCSKNDWQRAFNEINEFEKELDDWGAIVVKFWVQIDKDTQLERFTERQNTPEKQWKITDEDWRNREKWNQYEKAIDEMIAKTSTEFAPWYILESNDKHYARIQALKILIAAIEERLAK